MPLGRPSIASLFVLSWLAVTVRAEVPFRGIVEDAAGSRVSGAQVSIEGGGRHARTTTGADGSFALVLPAGARALRVRAAGFAEERLSLPSPPPETLTVVLRPASRAEQITVTATLTPTRLAETPASVVALPAAALAATAAPTLDDALRQVPGFGLFRRTGSRTANPTSQGVSLRGLGASGASRAVVLVDGLPLNDPFGGWVYWARVPRDAIEQVEVLRGGASNLYGSSALGGVVQVLTSSRSGPDSGCASPAARARSPASDQPRPAAAASARACS